MAFEPERSKAFGSIGAGYTQVGTDIADAIRIIVLQNQTDVAVTFSFDGINDTITLQTKSTISLDICTNRTLEQGLFLPIGAQIWVKQTTGAASLGSVYVSAFYGTSGNNAS